MQKLGHDSNQHKTQRKRYRLNTKYLLIAPGLLNTFIFLLIPTILIFIISLDTFEGGHYGPPLTLENYIYFLKTPAYMNSLYITLRISTIVTIACLVLGYPIAYLLAMYITDESTTLIVMLMILVPWWIDFSTRSMAWLPVLGRQGLVNMFLMAIGVINEPVGYFIYNEFSAIAVMIQGSILFMIGPILFSLAKIDKNLIEAAETLGANRFRAFYNVTFRMSAPGVVIGSIFVFVAQMADFANPRILGGGLMPIGLNVYNQVGFMNWPLASAMSMVLTVLILAVVAILIRIVDIKKMLF